MRFRYLLSGRDVAHDDFQEGWNIQILINWFMLVLHDSALVDDYILLTDSALI
jgi:hypothetical protein